MTTVESSVPKNAVPLLLALSDNFVANKSVYDLEEIALLTTVSNVELCSLLHRLNDWGVIEINGGLPHGVIDVRGKIVDVAHSLRNLPPPNHWANFTAWFTSRKWTLPIVAIIAGTPVIYCWVEIIKSVLSWLN